MKQFYQKIKPLLPVITLVFVICILSFFIPKEAIKALIIKSGIFAPLVFILISLSTYVFAPLSGTPIMAVGYWTFGSKIAMYAIIVEILASIINFWISRLWGMKLVSRLAGRENMKKVNEFTQEYGLVTLFLSKFFLRGFIDVISYGAGLTNMTFIPYLIVSILAFIPGTLMMYYISTLTKNTAQFIVIMVSISCLFLLIFPWLEKKRKKNDKGI